RTPRHIYAQVTDPVGAKVIAMASTLQEAVRQGLKNTGNVEAAKAVGRAIATRAKAAGVSKVAFDRSGFQFHGRVKALADAAREAGLEFYAGNTHMARPEKGQPADEFVEKLVAGNRPARGGHGGRPLGLPALTGVGEWSGRGGYG